jgi:hypothetical protein
MRSLSAKRNAFLVRILVTISPRLYREAIALVIHRHRPDFEVLLAPPDSLDGEAKRFGPHALVQDAEEAGLPPEVSDGVVCRVRVLKTTERMDATIELGGATRIGLSKHTSLLAVARSFCVLRARWCQAVSVTNLPRSALSRRVPGRDKAVCVSVGSVRRPGGVRTGPGARCPRAGPPSRRRETGARNLHRARRTRSRVRRPRARAL